MRGQADPLVTQERRLAHLENLACRLNDLKRIVGVRWPRQEMDALLKVIRDERHACAEFRRRRAESGIA